jgi:redox-regulated HSP33 family molecular chaperone
MLQRFPATDRDDMVENGEITVTCEFCSSVYRLRPGDLAP